MAAIFLESDDARIKNNLDILRELSGEEKMLDQAFYRKVVQRATQTMAAWDLDAEKYRELRHRQERIPPLLPEGSAEKENAVKSVESFRSNVTDEVTKRLAQSLQNGARYSDLEDLLAILREVAGSDDVYSNYLPSILTGDPQILRQIDETLARSKVRSVDLDTLVQIAKDY